MSVDSIWTDSALHLLREVMIGLEEDESVWVTDGGYENSLLGTLAGLSAGQASIAPQGDGTTIAAIAGHILFIFQFGNTYLKGARPDMSWEDSWRIREVDDDGWDELRDELQREYEATVDLVNAVPEWTHPMLVQGTLAFLPHVSYHFGAIRQLRKLV